MRLQWHRTCELAGNADGKDRKRAAPLLLAMQSTVYP
jgi:hypothetical protein